MTLTSSCPPIVEIYRNCIHTYHLFLTRSSIYTPQESGVFFLEGEITPLIKIGFTTNPARYFAKIKEWSSDIYACIHFIPSEKNVLAPTMPLYMALELHRVSGRWYNIADSLLALMQKCETVEELEKLLVN